MSKRNKILIVPMWGPAEIPDLVKFSRDNDGLLSASTFDAEVFKENSTPASITHTAFYVDRLIKAEEWGLYSGFTHVLTLDMALSPGAAVITSALERNKEIVVAGKDSSGFRVRTDKNESNWGFGFCLFQSGVPRSCPLRQAYGGDFLSPWKCWAKFARLIDMKIWVDYDIDLLKR